MYTVITENDESKWDDVTGEIYHFPRKYLDLLKTGTKIIYYKGRMKNSFFEDKRLTTFPHYFGIGTIGEVTPVHGKTEYKARIVGFKKFTTGLPAKINNKYFEEIPVNLKNNYWRNGVRSITKVIYNKLLNVADFENSDTEYNDQQGDQLVTTITEGGKKLIFTIIYERKKANRDRAISLHGYTCKVCDFNFKGKYGNWGEGYIHVHHLKPLHKLEEKIIINPQTDLTVVCANCHSMIHRKKNVLLSIEELREMVRSNKR